MREKSRSASPPDRPSALLGVDAGGSQTTAAIAGDNLQVLGRAEGPGAPMRPGGASASAAIITETARQAAATARLRLPADRAVVGAAGAGRTPEQEELAAALTHAGVAHRVRVVADAEVALAAAFERGPGILLNAGTGSVAFARDPRGQIRRSGGYGWQLGDEGGGYWLGRVALAAAARAHEGRGEGVALLERLLAALGLQHFDDLIRWGTAATPAQVAALAPHVLAAAREGDGVAQRAVRDGARELVGLVAALERHFPGGGPVPVALAGGLLLPDSPLSAAVRDALAEHAPRTRVDEGPVDPVIGALRLAREMD